MLTKIHRQPWFAEYVYRFEGVRSNGDRSTLETKIHEVTEGLARKKLLLLLGQGRYEISFLGIEEIPIKDWPLYCKLGCGLDKHGNRAAPSNGTARGGTPIPVKAAGAAQPGTK